MAHKAVVKFLTAVKQVHIINDFLTFNLFTITLILELTFLIYVQLVQCSVKPTFRYICVVGLVPYVRL